MGLRGSLLTGRLARASAWKSGFVSVVVIWWRDAGVFIPAAAAHARLRVCGALCRALQDSSALLSAHHHHHHSLRIVRNRAGPLPARRPPASYTEKGVPSICAYARSGPVQSTVIRFRSGKPPPDHLLGPPPSSSCCCCRVWAASEPGQSNWTSLHLSLFLLSTPPPPRQSASCAVRGTFTGLKQRGWKRKLAFKIKTRERMANGCCLIQLYL